MTGRYRVTNLQKGDAGWKSARIEPRLAGCAPVSFEATAEWHDLALTWPIPEGTDAFELLLGFWESAGVFDLAGLKLAPVGGRVPAPALERSEAPLDPATLADRYTRALVAETRHLRPLQGLLGPTDLLLPRLDFQNIDGQASRHDVDVAGLPFDRAMHIVTEKKKEEWRTHTQCWFPSLPLRRGDVVYVTAMARFIKARDDGRPSRAPPGCRTVLRIGGAGGRAAYRERHRRSASPVFS